MRYQCVCLVIQNSAGDYLLQMRDNTPGIICPLMWDSFGGGAEEGESMESAAVRELQEELGITAEQSDFELVGTVTIEGRTEDFLRLKRSVEWGDFKVYEGAGAGFFSREEILLIDASPPVKEFYTNSSY